MIPGHIQLFIQSLLDTLNCPYIDTWIQEAQRCTNLVFWCSGKLYTKYRNIASVRLFWALFAFDTWIQSSPLIEFSALYFTMLYYTVHCYTALHYNILHFITLREAAVRPSKYHKFYTAMISGKKKSCQKVCIIY